MAKMICYPAIESRRKNLGVPKQKMADYLNISQSALDNKLRGRNEFKFSEIVAISDWWGTTIEQLADGAYEIEPQSADGGAA